MVARVTLSALCALAVLVAALGCADAAPPAPPPDPVVKYAGLLTDFPFGGRKLGWWSARLAELAPGGAHPDATLYRLTVDRARNNGLVVDEASNTVQPGQEVTVLLLLRLGVLQ